MKLSVDERALYQAWASLKFILSLLCSTEQSGEKIVFHTVQVHILHHTSLIFSVKGENG
jgi:hypothetical protein